jgi:hypothetical protein
MIIATVTAMAVCDYFFGLQKRLPRMVAPQPSKRDKQKRFLKFVILDIVPGAWKMARFNKKFQTRSFSRLWK